MNQEQEIESIKRELLELLNDYFNFHVSLYYRVIIIVVSLLLGLIVGFLV